MDDKFKFKTFLKGVFPFYSHLASKFQKAVIRTHKLMLILNSLKELQKVRQKSHKLKL